MGKEKNMLSSLANLVLTGGTDPAVNWGNLITADSFDGIINGVTTALPIVLPVMFTLMGIPIVIGLVRKTVKQGK